MMDCSGDGLIAKKEFFTFTSTMGVDPATSKGLWTSIDVITDDEVIDDIELAQSPSLQRLRHAADEKLGKLVAMIDKNDDDTITTTEMKDFLVDKCGLGDDPDGVDERLREIDANDDGTISMEELKRCKVLLDLIVRSGLATMRIDGPSAAMRRLTGRSTQSPMTPPPPSPPPPQQVDLDEGDDCDLAWVCKRSPDYRTADGPSGGPTDAVGTGKGVVAFTAGFAASGGPTDAVGTGKGVVAFTAGLAAISLGVMVIR